MEQDRTPQEVAHDFIDLHSDRLKSLGLLTPATLPAFLLLARTYAIIETMEPDNIKNGWVQYFAHLKAYQTYARGFGMNTDKPKVGQATTEKDEFDL